jgi:hypothetical protein
MYEILEFVELREDLPDWEQFYIDLYDSFLNGYNMSMAISNKDTWTISKGSRPLVGPKISLWWAQDNHKDEQSVRVKARFTENPDAMIKLMARSTDPTQVEVFKKRMRAWRDTLTAEEASALAKKSFDSKSKNPECLLIAEIRQRVAKAKRWLNNQLPKHNHFGFKNIAFVSHIYKGVHSMYVACKYVTTDGKKVGKKFSVTKLGLLPAMAEACKWRDEAMTPMYEKYIKENENV